MTPGGTSAVRRPGQRKDDLSDETTERLLKVAKSLVRTDFGGSGDSEAFIKKKAADEGLDLGPRTCAFIKKFLEHQVEGCRKRIGPRLDEAIRRSSKS